MSDSPTARLLCEAIETTELTQTEIAQRAGFNRPSTITMMMQGLTRVPLPRIPALAQVLGMDQEEFLLLAIEEYHRGVHDVLSDTFGLPHSDVEHGLVLLFRLANLREDVELQEPLRKALEGVFNLAEAAKS